MIALTALRGYLIAGSLAAIIAGVGVVYLKGRTDAAHKAEISELRAQVAEQIALRQEQAKHIVKVNKAARQAAERAIRDAARISSLKKQAEEIANAARENPGVCVGADNSDRLRNYFGAGENYLLETVPSGDPK